MHSAAWAAGSTTGASGTNSSTSSEHSEFSMATASPRIAILPAACMRSTMTGAAATGGRSKARPRPSISSSAGTRTATHLWFRRDDLVEKVNRILAEWYGEVIADGQTQEPDIFAQQKAAARTPARRFGFFPTPEAAARAVIEKAGLYRLNDDKPFTILEPSAGTGNLARLCATAGEPARESWERPAAGGPSERVRIPARPFDHRVDCVELQPELAKGLRAEGIYRRVTCGDFLKMAPDPKRLYDRVIMNPPFDLGRDQDHVVHALKFLQPGGMLVAIMSAGTEFRSDKKTAAFRQLMIARNARFDDLPAGSFSEVGTNVNTILVTIGGSGYGGRRFEG